MTRHSHGGDVGDRSRQPDCAAGPRTRSRDIDVIYYTVKMFAAVVENAGARWRPYPPNTISAQVIALANRSGGPLRVVARGLPRRGHWCRSWWRASEPK